MRLHLGHLLLDCFSIPFFVAAALGMLTLVAAVRWLPESRAEAAIAVAPAAAAVGARLNARGMGGLLTLAALAPLGLALFEATFALYAQRTLNYGAAAVGTVFVVCGLVMTVFQVGALSLLAGRIVWKPEAPYLITGALLVAVAARVASRSRGGSDRAGVSDHDAVQPLQRITP